MNRDSLDKATTIRKGEELNQAALRSYLKSELTDFPDDFEISQFPSGFSNLTYLITTGEQEYVLRRPPFGAKIKSAHDMGREFRVLNTLQPVYPKIPKPVLFCEDESILGAPFYMMERVKGIILRKQPPKDERFNASTMHKISVATIDNLVKLHSLDLESSGLINLGKPEGYNRRQVEGWIKRYHNAQTDKISSMEIVAAYLQAHIPKDIAPAFIHNDYKYDNIVLDQDAPAQIKAVLDWEMSTVGNPLMDLATTLAYWVEAEDSPALKPFNLTWLKGNLTRSEVVDYYQEKSGRNLSDLVYYFVFASFKLGVIVQQIYARYKKGLTKDPRFAMLIEVVKVCGHNGQMALEKDRISKLK